MANLWERTVDAFMNLSGAGKTVVVLISVWAIRTIFRR